MTSQLDIAKPTALFGVGLALVSQAIAIPIAGHLSDKVGRRPIIMTGAIILGLAIFPSFVLINTGVPGLVFLAYFLGFPIGSAMVFAPSAAMLPELFNPNVRFTGTSVVFQFSSLAAGFVPAIAVSLLILGNGTPWFVCVFVVLLAVITWTCTYLLPETFARDIEKED